MDLDMIPTFCITVVTHMALVNGHWQVSGLGIFFVVVVVLVIDKLSKSIH